jgi:hypothetical protein
MADALQESEMPRQSQGHISLEWRGETSRRQLPLYTDWLRSSPTQLWCDVLTLSPPLRLRWWYNQQQIQLRETWECSAVWVHSAALENGSTYLAPLFIDLEEAINIIAQNKLSVQYTLLVAPGGMQYDVRRFGGDHQVRTATGRMFTFSVRRDANNNKILLAIVWN